VREGDRTRIERVLRSAVPDVVTSECCGSCSVALVPDDSTGFAYFHSQDAERAFNRKGEGKTLTGPLYIGFGHGDDRRSRDVGRRLKGALSSAGFVVDWNDNPGTRLRIVGVTETRSLL